MPPPPLAEWPLAGSQVEDPLYPLPCTSKFLELQTCPCPPRSPSFLCFPPRTYERKRTCVYLCVQHFAFTVSHSPPSLSVSLSSNVPKAKIALKPRKVLRSTAWEVGSISPFSR